MHMDMGDAGGWQFMQDGALFALFNHQGGPRGDTEFKAPNWWMGMAARDVGESRLTLHAMFSLDPATAGRNGYADLFQVGEALDGRPLVDRQHPHDFFMQLSASWRTSIGDATALTISGGPVAEPALGPVAFMHRPSASEYPFAPLSHHTFDSTHITFGVVTMGIERGPVTAEASVFNGREPDERRWDFDFGRLDSVSGRMRYRPRPTWEFQVSTGRLVDPEQLEPGNLYRTTASASWLSREGDNFTAVMIGYGVNRHEQLRRQALTGEITRRAGPTSFFGRVEVLQSETALLLGRTLPLSDEQAQRKDVIGAFTIGAVRDVAEWGGLAGGVGAAATVYAVPDALRGAYGSQPVSFQVYFRVRPRGGHHVSEGDSHAP